MHVQGRKSPSTVPLVSCSRPATSAVPQAAPQLAACWTAVATGATDAWAPWWSTPTMAPAPALLAVLAPTTPVWIVTKAASALAALTQHQAPHPRQHAARASPPWESAPAALGHAVRNTCNLCLASQRMELHGVDMVYGLHAARGNAALCATVAMAELFCLEISMRLSLSLQRSHRACFLLCLISPCC
jgi:hypothetical protein